MKKIIHIIGVICLIIVIILNIVYTAFLDNSEHITINNNSFVYICGIIALAICMYIITNIINKKCVNLDTKKKRIYLIITIIVYAMINIIWIIVVRPPVVGDQVHACNLAQTFYNNNLEKFLPNITYAGIPLSQYMQSYHQQISLSFVFSLFFRIIHLDYMEILRIVNVAANIATVIALYKIIKHLSKKYETNKIRLLFLILTFIPLIMLSTFIYGDILSLALCLLSVYFIMKYTESKKIKYAIIASLLTMIAYMARMNSLIYIIATVIYLVLSIFENFKTTTWKEKLIKILIIAMYVCISIIPTSMVQNYYLDKYNMDKDAEYPVISYILMAMEESWRSYGWYNEARGEYALKNIEKAKIEYVDEIKNRLEYFSENKGYAFEFYTKKLASMWTENTYASVTNNITKENDSIENIKTPLEFYQKSILILICTCSCIFIIQNRKKLSIDVIFLITIFIGGFFFHILWEAKSRYIIPYIVVLMPVAGLKIRKIQIIDKIKNFQKK